MDNMQSEAELKWQAAREAFLELRNAWVRLRAGYPTAVSQVDQWNDAIAQYLAIRPVNVLPAEQLVKALEKLDLVQGLFEKMEARRDRWKRHAKMWRRIAMMTSIAVKTNPYTAWQQLRTRVLLPINKLGATFIGVMLANDWKRLDKPADKSTWIQRWIHESGALYHTDGHLWVGKAVEAVKVADWEEVARTGRDPMAGWEKSLQTCTGCGKSGVRLYRHGPPVDSGAVICNACVNEARKGGEDVVEFSPVIYDERGVFWTANLASRLDYNEFHRLPEADPWNCTWGPEGWERL